MTSAFCLSLLCMGPPVSILADEPDLSAEIEQTEIFAGDSTAESQSPPVSSDEQTLDNQDLSIQSDPDYKVDSTASSNLETDDSLNSSNLSDGSSSAILPDNTDSTKEQELQEESPMENIQQESLDSSQSDQSQLDESSAETPIEMPEENQSNLNEDESKPESDLTEKTEQESDPAESGKNNSSEQDKIDSNTDSDPQSDSENSENSQAEEESEILLNDNELVLEKTIPETGGAIKIQCPIGSVETGIQLKALNLDFNDDRLTTLKLQLDEIQVVKEALNIQLISPDPSFNPLKPLTYTLLVPDSNLSDAQDVSIYINTKKDPAFRKLNPVETKQSSFRSFQFVSDPVQTIAVTAVLPADEEESLSENSNTSQEEQDSEIANDENRSSEKADKKTTETQNKESENEDAEKPDEANKESESSDSESFESGISDQEKEETESNKSVDSQALNNEDSKFDGQAESFLEADEADGNSFKSGKNETEFTEKDFEEASTILKAKAAPSSKSTSSKSDKNQSDQIKYEENSDDSGNSDFILQKDPSSLKLENDQSDAKASSVSLQSDEEQTALNDNQRTPPPGTFPGFEYVTAGALQMNGTIGEAGGGWMHPGVGTLPDDINPNKYAIGDNWTDLAKIAELTENLAIPWYGTISNGSATINIPNRGSMNNLTRNSMTYTYDPTNSKAKGTYWVQWYKLVVDRGAGGYDVNYTFNTWHVDGRALFYSTDPVTLNFNIEMYPDSAPALFYTTTQAPPFANGPNLRTDPGLDI